MNRWIQTLSCMASSSLLAWGSNYAEPPQTVDPAAEIKYNFPLNPDQQWFTKETYLIMKPYEDDSDYATKLTTKASASDVEMSMRLEKPDFDWYSGARIGIGRYLANHDRWDITLFTTYFYAQEDDSSSPQRSKGALLTPLWNPTFEGGATKGEMTWRLNFFNWDLSAGREYNILKTIVAHPFIGVRTALIYKDYKTNYSDRFRGLASDQLLNAKYKASDRYWGIGPRAGVDLQFIFKDAWSFLGSFSGALFYGYYQVQQKTSTSFVSTGTIQSNRFHSKDNRYCIRANLDTSLGMGYETWVKNHTVRLVPSILFEASCWFDTNQFFLTQSKNLKAVTPNFTNIRRQGNLILMGFSFNLQADF